MKSWSVFFVSVLSLNLPFNPAQKAAFGQTAAPTPTEDEPAQGREDPLGTPDPLRPRQNVAIPFVFSNLSRGPLYMMGSVPWLRGNLSALPVFAVGTGTRFNLPDNRWDWTVRANFSGVRLLIITLLGADFQAGFHLDRNGTDPRRLGISLRPITVSSGADSQTRLPYPQWSWAVHFFEVPSERDTNIGLRNFFGTNVLSSSWSMTLGIQEGARFGLFLSGWILRWGGAQYEVQNPNRNAPGQPEFYITPQREEFGFFNIRGGINATLPTFGRVTFQLLSELQYRATGSGQHTLSASDPVPSMVWVAQLFRAQNQVGLEILGHQLGRSRVTLYGNHEYGILYFEGQRNYMPTQIRSTRSANTFEFGVIYSY